ncbi:ATP-binding protein [Dactylosporangium fulvum]|uniref:ATP-binding protein n=1 Tax=Dactylosporangium fulvum TaxID=53359 RepID=A0ABY5VQU0_9ACTN|nr:ATP-binding protein [Dactylosporangium fulvum]UWP79550.1 ATP-binding protein [Dactylosporangium fulvum]
MKTSRLAFNGEVDDAIIAVGLHGRWNRALRLDLAAGLRKCFAEQPRAVLVDLADLDDPAAQCVSTLLAGYHAAAAADPPVPLLVCAPGAAVRERLVATGVDRSIGVHDTVDAARAAVRAGVPMPTVRRIELPGDYMSAAIARDVTGQVCIEWSLGHLLHPARLIISELVTNAIEHSGGPFTVRLSLRGRLLHLAVQDRNPALPFMIDPAGHAPDARRPLDERGLGLRIVATEATAWGAMPCRFGKTVWATLRALPLPA